ncbi:MAG: DMT family transporter [Pseudomonadota bacterium]
MKRAIILMLIGMSCIPAGDAASKMLTSTLDVAPGFVAFTRFAVAAVIVLPFASRGGWGVFADPLVWLRGALIGGGISSITVALETVDLATAFGGLFFAPIVSFVSAAVFLREPTSPARLALVVMGFVGVLMVAQPGLTFTIGKGLAVMAGLFYGLYLTVSRVTAQHHAPLKLLLSQLCIAALLSAPFGLSAVPQISAPIGLYTLLSALFSMVGNLLLILAYALAPATRLAPLVYFQLIVALTLGWGVFGHWPNPLACAGLMVIALSGWASVLVRR